MRTILRFIFAVLMLPRQVPKMIKAMRHVVQSMTNNAFFPSPSPTLAEIDSANNDLEQAEINTASRTKGLAEVRDEKARTVRSLARLLVAYVQRIADANPAKAAEIIRSAGMTVKDSTGHGRPDFEVKQGKASGEVILIVKRTARYSAYEWQFGTDGKTWTTLPTTVHAKTTVSNLGPGTTYTFRFRVVTKAGEGEWSQVITFLVK